MKTHEFLTNAAVNIYSALIAISDLETRIEPQQDAEIAWDCARALLYAAPESVKTALKEADSEL